MELLELLSKEAYQLLNESLMEEVKAQQLRPFCEIVIKFQNGKIVDIIKADRFR